MAKKKKVSFWATRKVPKQVKVKFRTKSGERVSFTATRKVPKQVKVKFWASSSGKRVKRRRR